MGLGDDLIGKPNGADVNILAGFESLVRDCSALPLVRFSSTPDSVQRLAHEGYSGVVCCTPADFLVGFCGFPPCNRCPTGGVFLVDSPSSSGKRLSVLHLDTDSPSELKA